MSLDTKKNTATSDTGPAVTSARPPRQDQIESQNESRPPRLRGLSRLLTRENVDFVIVVGGAKSMAVKIDMGDGKTDSKSFRVGDGVGDAGCFVIMRLSDNPASVGDGFYEVAQP